MFKVTIVPDCIPGDFAGKIVCSNEYQMIRGYKFQDSYSPEIEEDEYGKVVIRKKPNKWSK